MKLLRAVLFFSPNIDEPLQLMLKRSRCVDYGCFNNLKTENLPPHKMQCISKRPVFVFRCLDSVFCFSDFCIHLAYVIFSDKEKTINRVSKKVINTIVLFVFWESILT